MLKQSEVRLVSGASYDRIEPTAAAELDAKRAIRQGTEVAAAL